MAEAITKVEGVELEVRKLKYQRRGKKGSITKRVKGIDTMIQERQSRRMVQGMLEALMVVFQELEDVCVKLLAFQGEEEEEDAYNDIEEVRANVDACQIRVREYFEARADDPPPRRASKVAGVKS